MKTNDLYETDETILKALSRNAADIPNCAALIYDNVTHTWKELDELTSCAAAELIRRGVKKGDCVGIKIGSGGLGMTAIWSVLKTGASYLPLNPVFPEARVEFMSSDAGVKIILTEDGVSELIKSTESYAGTEQPELPEVTGKDKFAVMYTSGSTGTPKCNRLLHRTAVPYARHFIKTVGLSSDDTVAMYSGFSFVLHIADLYVHALSGAALYMIPAEVKLDIRQLSKCFADHNVTVCACPTGIGKKFVASIKSTSLKSMIVVGEKLTPFTSANPSLKMFNAYGCTECAGGVSIGQVQPSRGIHIGKEADDIVISITDENGVPVQSGEEGELCVSIYGHLHKTGDLAKRDKDGNIVIIGRRDFQLNVRGYRVEPGEIEACILKVAEIAETVVVTHDERLVAYYATENGEAVATQEFKDHMSQLLPPYMIPAAFVRLDKLPRNVNGKVDRLALPEPPRNSSASEGESIAAEKGSETERKLAAIWGRSLGINKKNILTNEKFSELGGDSLKLIMLSIEIEETFRIIVTPAELLKIDILAEQAKLIENMEEYKPIFTFCANGDKAPLFFTHTANTGPEAFAKYAELSPKDQPFYAFEHHNLTRSENFGIKKLSKIYVDEILRLYPNTQFSLGGWSLGGLTAFEMALILEQQGRPIKHLYLFDPQICGDEERAIHEKLGSSPYYREYLENDPLFESFRAAGHIERLIDNNAFMAKEASNYRPERVLNCPATLFKMTLPDSVSHANAEEQEILSRLWELQINKADNGFGAYAKNLNIVNINQMHDRLMSDKPSMEIIINAVSRNNAL